MALSNRALIAEFDIVGTDINIGTVNAGAWSLEAASPDIPLTDDPWYYWFQCEAGFAEPADIGTLELHFQMRDVGPPGTHGPEPGTGSTAFNVSKIGDFRFVRAGGVKQSQVLVWEPQLHSNKAAQNFRIYLLNPMAQNATLVTVRHGSKAPSRKA